MRVVNVHYAKTNLSKILDEVKAGEDFILAKMGKPYARLSPLQSPKKVPMGFLKGEIGEEIFDPLPEEELAEWEHPIL